MTDSLRDKIAAVLAAHRNYGNDCECGWVDTTGLYKEFTGHEQHVAEAVIAELGLTRQSQTGEIVNMIEGDNINYGRHRYVTEWEPDE